MKRFSLSLFILILVASLSSIGFASDGDSEVPWEISYDGISDPWPWEISYEDEWEVSPWPQEGITNDVYPTSGFSGDSPNGSFAWDEEASGTYWWTEGGITRSLDWDITGTAAPTEYSVTAEYRNGSFYRLKTMNENNTFLFLNAQSCAR